MYSGPPTPVRRGAYQMHPHTVYYSGDKMSIEQRAGGLANA